MFAVHRTIGGSNCLWFPVKGKNFECSQYEESKRWSSDRERVTVAGRNVFKLIVSEALEYMRQLSENESVNGNDEEIALSNDAYASPDEENISSDGVFNFPVQCTSRKPLEGRKNNV
ncbi:hypothetical protein TNCV_2552181 [Trichonephila clavipes]|nr:hypothetical protein TNCV_2552181 [Trichonephila clavipes]